MLKLVVFCLGMAGAAQAAEPGPQAAFKISDDIYYVGTVDVTSYLIDGGDGLIVTDGGYASSAPIIEANIKALGFDIKNVKVLLNSHAHFDHSAGLARLKADSGAKFYAAPGDVPVLESGGKADFSPGIPAFAPIKVDAQIKDGEKITVGKATLTMHITPGHTRGCTSWTMQTKIDGKPVNVLMVCSLTVLPQYRLVKNPSYPGIADDFKKSVATLRSLPCDVMLASHGSMFNMKAKIEKMAPGAASPFIDPQGCRRYLDDSAKIIDETIAKESTQ